MRTDRGFERLITFADAVVAIALTLLVLPLSEIASELSRDTSVGQVFSDNGAAFGSFALSFVVIWVLWTAHHRTMEYFDAYDGVLFRLTMIWLFTIVLLPFITQLLTGSQYDRGATPLYEGLLLVSSLCLTGMSWWGRRHRDLLADDPQADRWSTTPIPIGVPAVLVISLLLTLIFPSIGAYPLFLLLAAYNVIDRARLRRWQRRQPG
ncbi:MAG TPA: TMEM175 family protein [Mycobacteriales bacterium]|nr:TMEM175 family protein [Mycobacteriales bacterium]